MSNDLIQIKEKSIVEYKSMLDKIDKSYDFLRSKITIYTGAQLAVSILIYAGKPMQCIIPPESKRLHTSDFASYEKFLDYIATEYHQAIHNNTSVHEKKQNFLSIATVQMIAGSVILMVIKSFVQQN